MPDYQASFKRGKLRDILSENPDATQFVVTITTDANGTVTAAIMQPITDAASRTAPSTKNGCPYPPGC